MHGDVSPSVSGEQSTRVTKESLFSIEADKPPSIKALRQICLIAVTRQSRPAIDTYYPYVIDTTLQSCFEERELHLIRQLNSSPSH